MRLTSTLTLCALACVATAARSTTPPPAISFDERVCKSTHIFVSTTSNYREVNTCPIVPDVKPAPWCIHAEVDVTVERFIKPKEVKLQTLVYRFGGGMFNMQQLRSDLEGHRLLFLSIQTEKDGKIIYRTSHGWFLAADPSSESDVISKLTSCHGPN